VDDLEDQLTLFAGGSHAKTSAQQDARQASTVPALGYGDNSPELLAKFNPDTRSWRTSQLCFLEIAGDGLAEFSETWPRSGMTRNGTAYQLAPLVRLTGGTVSGLLPTPAETEYGSNQGGAAGRVGPVRYSLGTMARKGMRPTPTTVDHRDLSLEAADKARKKGQQVRLAGQVRWPTPTVNGNYNRKGLSKDSGDGLHTAVNRQWPTPLARDSRSLKGAQRSPNAQGAEPLVVQVGGALNPTWVEWLMGFPEGWTDLNR
jgi:hypothetical protein